MHPFGLISMAEGKKNRLTENMKLLCQHYGIEYDSSQFTELSLRLANNFVRGFQIKRKRGNKLKWDQTFLAVLKIEVDRYQDPSLNNNNKMKGIRWSIRQLLKKEPWIHCFDGANPFESMKRQYYNCDEGSNEYKNVKELFEDFKSHNQLHLWETIVVNEVVKQSKS